MKTTDEADVAAWVGWCEANELDPWPHDRVAADAQLSDWLFLCHRDRGNGFARLRILAGAVGAAFRERGLDDPRGPQEAMLRSAIRECQGVRAESRKIDPLTSADIHTVVVAGLLASSATTVPAARRSLAIELGHTHGVPTSELPRVRREHLGERTVTVDGIELAVETDLTPLRELDRAFGPRSRLNQLIRYFEHRTCFEVPLEPVVGAGLSAEQARWARFGASHELVAALMWLSYLLVGNAWALRHNDLTRIHIEDVSKQADGTGFIVVGGKTVQDGDQRRLEIGHDHAADRFCAACLLWSWAQWCREGEGRSEGPLWVSRYGAHASEDKAVSGSAATTAMRRAIAGMPLADKRISTRSLRVGTSTEMAAAGMSLEQIMLVTGHETVSEALRYIRLLSPNFQPHLRV